MKTFTAADVSRAHCLAFLAVLCLVCRVAAEPPGAAAGAPNPPPRPDRGGSGAFQDQVRPPDRSKQGGPAAKGAGPGQTRPPPPGKGGRPPMGGPAASAAELGHANAVYLTIFNRDGDVEETRKVLDLAESPDGIFLCREVGGFKASEVLVYYVDFSEFDGRSQKTTTRVVSTADDKTFSTPQAVTLDDKEIEAGRIADPSVVQLDDGRLRLYFMNTMGPNERTTPIYSATSTDGVHFAMDDGIRLYSTDNVEVVRVGADWFMFMSNYRTNQSAVATSKDGLTWVESPSGKTVPGSGIGACERDGELEYYTHSGIARGLVKYGFNEQTATADENDRMEWFSHGGAADASPVALPDGRTFIFYKRLGG